MSVNIPLLREAVQWVELQNERRSKGLDSWWRQRSYVVTHDFERNSCGTAYCVAGWVGLRLKPEWFKRQDEISIQSKAEQGMWAHLFDCDGDLHVADFAQEALGLTTEQADLLFMGGNRVSDIRRIAEEIAGGPL